MTSLSTYVDSNRSQHRRFQRSHPKPVPPCLRDRGATLCRRNGLLDGTLPLALDLEPPSSIIAGQKRHQNTCLESNTETTGTNQIIHISNACAYVCAYIHMYLCIRTHIAQMYSGVSCQKIIHHQPLIRQTS